MKTKILQPVVLLSIIAVLGVALAYEVVQGHRRSQRPEPPKGQPAINGREEALHERFVKRTAQDQEKYTPQQLSDAEQLYVVANQKLNTPEAKESLQIMIQKYPDINRTGCAMLMLGQISQGDERGKTSSRLH